MPEPLKGAEVRIEGLVKTYGHVRAAAGVSLAIGPGQFVTLLGPSGSGKTTTLMIVAGFVEPDAGEVFIAGKRVTETPAHRRGLGMVFQHYALFPHMTIFQNIAYPLRMRRVPRNQIRDRVQAALDLVQLPDIGPRHPRQLSGGQQQRVAVARALVFEPQVLLMDEPLGALDRKLREQMQVELRSLQQKLGITTLYVTHDQEEAMALSDQVVVMCDGRIEQKGTPADLYERPQSQFVADFIGASNRIDGELQGQGGKRVFVTREGLQMPVSGPRMPEQRGPFQLMIRPERIRWADDGSFDTKLDGKVVAVTYLGERMRYLVQLQGGPMVTVTHANLKSEQRLASGAAVRVGWNREDVTIL
jgi:putative spermidine/putrescine transport system ATP-binding protein